MNIRASIVLLLASLLTISACTVVHTVPLAARKGDTVMVSIGSPNDPTTANVTSLTYTPDLPAGSSPINIPTSNIEAIFNMYPDKKSYAWLYRAIVIENLSGHGPWTTIFTLKVPNNLPEGTGSLQVGTNGGNYAGSLPTTNGVDIALEILPGTGETSSFDYLGFGQVVLDDPLSLLEPMKRLEFKPTWTGIDATNTYGAVEIKLGIDKRGIGEEDYNIVWDDKIGTIQSRNVFFTSNAKKFETTVYLISPTGKMQYSDASFAIISENLVSQFEDFDADPANGQDVYTAITVSSVTWYDIDGNVDTNGPPIIVVNLTGATGTTPP